MEQVKDFFGDELQVGKRYVFVLKSGSSYPAIAVVESIELVAENQWSWALRQNEKIFVPCVKVRREGKKYMYDRKADKARYEPYTYTKRIYNWETGIPLPEGK